MKGTRPLDNSEIMLVSACFDGTFEARNHGLFMLGVSTGGRISELLSLTIGDVYQNGAAVTDLLFDKSIVKRDNILRQAVHVEPELVEAAAKRIQSYFVRERLVEHESLSRRIRKAGCSRQRSTVSLLQNSVRNSSHPLLRRMSTKKHES